MRLLYHIRTLTLRDSIVLCWAAFTLPLADRKLKRHGFRQVYAWATEPHSQMVGEAQNTVGRAEQLARIINFVGRQGYQLPRCLCRSLVLLRAMHKEGIYGRLCIGVPKEGQVDQEALLDAHAWVEYRGQVINDRSGIADDYVLFQLD